MERQQRNNLAAFNLLAKKEDAVEELRGYINSNNNRSNILHIDDFKYGQPSDADLKLMTARLKLLQTSFDELSLPKPFKNSSEETGMELKFIRMLRKLSEDPNTVRDIEEEDKDLIAPFLRYAEANHLPVDEHFLRILLDDVNSIAMRFKYMFNRPRPQQLATQRDLELVTRTSESANTPSYPSAHTVAGRVIGKALGDKYPDFADEFEKIGASIGLHRLIAGLHYPTDHAAGVMLGDQIYIKGLVKDHTNFMMPDAEELVHAVQQAIAKHAEGFNLNKSIDDMSVLVDIFKAELPKRHIYVFGANLLGQNYGGSAEKAQDYGAKREGITGDEEDRIQGDTYSLVTKREPNRKKSSYMKEEEAEENVKKFVDFAFDPQNDHMVFHLANIGTEMAGFDPLDVAEWFDDSFARHGITVENAHEIKDKFLFDKGGIPWNYGTETEGLADLVLKGALPHDEVAYEMPKLRWREPTQSEGEQLGFSNMRPIDEDNHPINQFNIPTEWHGERSRAGNLLPQKHTFLSNFNVSNPYFDNDGSSVGGWMWNKETEEWEEDGKRYPSAEHAFQASKFDNEAIREEIRNAVFKYKYKDYKGDLVDGERASPLRAKNLAGQFAERMAIKNRGPEAEELMELIVRDKFTNDKTYAGLLLETGARKLIEGNTHGDHFWGNNGNRLGKILEKIRGELKAKYSIDGEFNPDLFETDTDYTFETKGSHATPLDYDYLRSAPSGESPAGLEYTNPFPLREHFLDGQIPLTHMDFDTSIPMSYGENVKRAFKNKPTDNLREELNDLQRQLVEIGDDQDLLKYENILPRIQRVQSELDENTAYNKLLENIGNTYNLMVTGDGKHRTSTTRKRSEVEGLEKGHILGIQDPDHEGRDFKGFLGEVEDIIATEKLSDAEWSDWEGWEPSVKEQGRTIWENDQPVGNESYNNGEYVTIKFRVMNDPERDGEQAIRHWVEAKHRFENPPDIDPTTLPDGGYTNHTGNAIGTDITGARTMHEKGITGAKGRSIGHSYNGHSMARDHSKYSVRSIHNDMTNDPEVLDRYARAAVRIAQGGESRNAKHRPTLKKLQRNWFQIANSDGVYAISRGFDGKNVMGGTAWGVAMAIGRGIPVHVFDQPSQQWYTWDNSFETDADLPPQDRTWVGGYMEPENVIGQDWVPTDEPLPAYQDFALIGTSKLDGYGEEAIERLVDNLVERQQDFFNNQTPYDKPEIVQTVEDEIADEMYANSLIRNQEILKEIVEKNDPKNSEITEDHVPEHIIDYNDKMGVFGDASREEIEDILKYRGIEARNRAVQQYRADYGIPEGEGPQTWRDLRKLSIEESSPRRRLNPRRIDDPKFSEQYISPKDPDWSGKVRREEGPVSHPEGEWLEGPQEQTGWQSQADLRYAEYMEPTIPEYTPRKFWGIPEIESNATSYVLAANNLTSPSTLSSIDVDSHPQLRVLLGENLPEGGGSMVLPRDEIKWVEDILQQQTWRNSINHMRFMQRLAESGADRTTWRQALADRWLAADEERPAGGGGHEPTKKSVDDYVPQDITPNGWEFERDESQRLMDNVLWQDRTQYFESEVGVGPIERLNGRPGVPYSGIIEKLEAGVDLGYNYTHALFVDDADFMKLVGSGTNRLVAGDSRDNINVKGHLMEILPMADEELERAAQGGTLPKDRVPSDKFVSSSPGSVPGGPKGRFVVTEPEDDSEFRYEEYKEPYATNKDVIEWDGMTKYVPVDQLTDDTQLIMLINKRYGGETPEQIDADYIDKEHEGDAPFALLDRASIETTEGKGNYNVSLQVALPKEDLLRKWDEGANKWKAVGMLQQLQVIADSIDPESFNNPYTPPDVMYKNAQVHALFDYIDDNLRLIGSENRDLSGGTSLLYNIGGETAPLQYGEPPEDPETGAVGSGREIQRKPMRTYTVLTRNEDGEYVREEKESPYNILTVPRPRTSDVAKILDMIRNMQGSIEVMYGEHIEPSNRFYSPAMGGDDPKVKKEVFDISNTHWTHADPAPYKGDYLTDPQSTVREPTMSAWEQRQMRELDRAHYQTIADAFVDSHKDWIGDVEIDTNPKSKDYGKDIGTVGLWPVQREHFYKNLLRYTANSEELLNHYVLSAMIGTESVKNPGQPYLVTRTNRPSYDNQIFNSLGPFLAQRIDDLKNAAKNKFLKPPTDSIEPPNPNALGYDVRDYNPSVWDEENSRLVPNPRRPKRPEPWDYDTDAEWKKADDLWDKEYDEYNEKEQAFLTWESKMDEYDAANPTGSIEWDMYYNGDANYKNALESINSLLRNPDVWGGRRLGPDGKTRVTKEHLFRDLLLNQASDGSMYEGQKYLDKFNKIVEKFTTGEYKKPSPTAYFLQTPISLKDIQAFGDALGFTRDEIMTTFKGEKGMVRGEAGGRENRPVDGRSRESDFLAGRAEQTLYGEESTGHSYGRMYGYSANKLNEEEEAFFQENPDFAKLLRGLATARNEKLFEITETAKFDKLEDDRERQDLLREQEGEEAAQQGLPEPDTPYSYTDVTFDDGELEVLEAQTNRMLAASILDAAQELEWADADNTPVTVAELANLFETTVNSSESTDQYIRDYDEYQPYARASRFENKLTRKDPSLNMDYIDTVLDDTERVIKSYVGGRILSGEEKEHIDNTVMQPIFDEFFNQEDRVYRGDDRQIAANPTEDHITEYMRRLRTAMIEYEWGDKPDFEVAGRTEAGREQVEQQQYRPDVTRKGFEGGKLPPGVDSIKDLRPEVAQVQSRLEAEEARRKLQGIAPFASDEELKAWIVQDAEERLKNEDRPRSTEEVRKIAHNLERVHQEQGYPMPTELYDISPGVKGEGYGRRVESAGEQPPITQPDPQRFVGRTVTSTPDDFEAHLESLRGSRHGDFAEAIRESLPTVESPYYTADPSWVKET